MQLKLISLVLLNFKGIENRTLRFNDVSNIYAKNRGGKTTIADSLTWLWTGKDNQGRKDYEIKNSVNTALNRGEHSVTAIYDKDGQELTLKRIYREKWATPRGSETPVMSGNETSYEINGVPKKAAEYDQFLRDLIPEDVLRMITNPNYFPNMHWEDQRKLIINIAGDVKDDKVLDSIMTVSNKGTFTGLIKALNDTSYQKGKQVGEYKKQVAAKIKKISEEQKGIEPRIQENIRSRPEPVNQHEVENSIVELQTRIEILDEKINDKSQADLAEQEAAGKIKKQIQTIDLKLDDLRFGFRREFNKETENAAELGNYLNRKLKEFSGVINDKRIAIGAKIKNIRVLVFQKKDFLDAWSAENNKEFKEDANQFVCGTCEQYLPDERIVELRATMRTNYNTTKKAKLDTINRNGKALSEQISQIKIQVNGLFGEWKEAASNKSALLEEITKIKSQEAKPILSIEERMAASDEVKVLVADKTALEATPDKPVEPEKAGTALKMEKAELNRLLDLEKAKLEINKRIAETDKRIDQLKADESRMAQEIANLQREEFAIQQFTVAKLDAIKSNVKSLFKYIDFNLFETQMNGGINQICELTLGGVRYGALNTEAKLNAGLDIINAISRHYNIYAPIVIDNRESVSEIIAVNSQVINLFVSTEFETLTLV